MYFSKCFIFKMVSYKIIHYEMELKNERLIINSNSISLYSGFQNGGDCTPGGMSDPLRYKNILGVLFIFTSYLNTHMYFKYNII